MPHALKTFLENQFLFYKAGPSDVRFTIWDGVHSRLFMFVDFIQKDRPIRNFSSNGNIAQHIKIISCQNFIGVEGNKFTHIRQ
jgi:hypothetical protein